jgi:hypothetical protein
MRRMTAFRRMLVILAALIAGNFVAANILLAGMVLTDVENLYYYSRWDYWGGPIVGYLLLTLFATVTFFVFSLVPALIVLIFTESLRIRSRWFYMMMAGLGSASLDVACTRVDKLISARSICNAPSISELAVVTMAGLAAGFVFWWIAGRRSGEWRARAATVQLTPV